MTEPRVLFVDERYVTQDGMEGLAKLGFSIITARNLDSIRIDGNQIEAKLDRIIQLLEEKIRAGERG